MRSYPYRVAGDETRIYLPETREDLERFTAWIRGQGCRRIAVDTEGTGLQQFSLGHRLRMVQFGTARQAWVLPVEHWPDAWATARNALIRAPRIVMHNAPFDLLELDRHLGVPLEHLARTTVDTRILAHLLDPRRKRDGGIGHALKPLAEHHIDPLAPDTQEGLAGVFRSLGHTGHTGWAAVPADHPVYVRYAGLDVIYTARLFDVLAPQIVERGLARLAEFERRVASVCARMERQGIGVDADYLATLTKRLCDEETIHQQRARCYGVTKIGSTRQVSSALAAMGEELTETTATGALRVDKEVLLPLADLDTEWERLGVRDANPVADAVVRGKRAGRWRVAYADAMRSQRDDDDRIHPKINSLQAVTARMSISDPALQQLPKADSTVRRAVVAEPGWAFGSVDYSVIEMRVLAALSGDQAMIRTIQDGVDLHDFTAEQIYGSGFSGYRRKIAKTVGFANVYGGKAPSIARRTGAPLSDITRAIATYNRVFPGVRRYARRLQARGQFGARELISPTDRILPVDRNRLYTATNYMVQSVSRDIFAQALVNLDTAGLTQYLRLPMHDEVIFTAPKDEARDIAEEMQDQMAVSDFFCVRLDTEAEIYGPRWQPDATQWVRSGAGSWRPSQAAA